MKLAKHEKWRKSFPYYKVQYRDYRLKVWQEVQKTFETEGKARKYGMALGRTYRVVEITRDRRRIV